jgi:hypothetical protein
MRFSVWRAHEAIPGAEIPVKAALHMIRARPYIKDKL